MLSALLLGTGLLLASLLSFSVAIVLVVSLMSRVIRTGYSGESFWKNVAIMMVVTLVMAAAHLMEIAIWAATFQASSEIRPSRRRSISLLRTTQVSATGTSSYPTVGGCSAHWRPSTVCCCSDFQRQLCSLP